MSTNSDFHITTIIAKAVYCLTDLCLLYTTFYPLHLYPSGGRTVVRTRTPGHHASYNGAYGTPPPPPPPHTHHYAEMP